MDIKIEKKDLVDVVSKVSRAAATTTVIPFLQGIHLKAAEGILTVIASNGEFAVKSSTPELQIDGEGEVLVMASYFDNFIRNLPAGVVSLTVKENKLNVKYGRSKATLNMFDASGYPGIPEVPDEILTIPAKRLKNGITTALPAVAKNHFRQVFTGILFDFKEDATVLVGTDTHRLAIAELESVGAKTGQYIVPGKAANELLKLLDNDDDVVVYGKDKLLFKIGGETEFLTNTISGMFPNYNKVIPSTFVAEAELNTDELRATLQRVLALPQETKKTPITTLVLDKANESLVVSSRSEIAGEIKEEIKLSKCSAQEELNVSFNSLYLLDAVKQQSKEITSIGFSGVLSPALFNIDETTKFIVVPLKA